MNRSVVLVCLSLFLGGCSGIKGLPSDPTTKGWNPVKLRYEQSSFFGLMKKTKDSGVRQVFVNPRDPKNMIVAIDAPVWGVQTTTDGGQTWTFCEVKRDTVDNNSNVTRTWFVFDDLIFDNRSNGKVYASAGGHFWRSDDAGKSWSTYSFVSGGFLGTKQTWLDLLEQGPDGALYATSGEGVYVSHDSGDHWSEAKIDAYKSSTAQKVVSGLTLGSSNNYTVFSTAPDPVDPATLYASIASHDIGSDFKGVGHAFAHMAGGADSPSQIAAVALVGSTDATPGVVSLGDGRDGVYVSHDSGAHWEKSGLMAKAYLAGIAGEKDIFAILKDSEITFATLKPSMKKVPEMAQQAQNGQPIDWEGYKASFAYPTDQNDLLFSDLTQTVIMRSADKGKTWSKVIAPTTDLLTRISTELQKQIAESHAPTQTAGLMQAVNRFASFYSTDPNVVLGTYNYNLPIHGMSSTQDGKTYYAYVPSSEYWQGLMSGRVEAMQALAHAASEKPKGGFHWGGGAHAKERAAEEREGYKYASRPNPDFIPTNGTFMLLRSNDGGAHWDVLADGASVAKTFDPDGSLLRNQKIVLYPSLIRASSERIFVVLTGQDDKGNSVAMPFQYVP